MTTPEQRMKEIDLALEDISTTAERFVDVVAMAEEYVNGTITAEDAMAFIVQTCLYQRPQ